MLISAETVPGCITLDCLSERDFRPELCQALLFGSYSFEKIDIGIFR